MNAVIALADHPYAQALAWALLHFLWQGALLGLAAMVCFRIFKQSSSVRYGIGVATLAAMLAAPVTTTIWIASRSTAVAATDSSVSLVRPAATAPAPLGLVPAATANAATNPTTPPLTNVVLAIWMAGVLALSIRLLGGWLTAHRVAQRQRRPATPEIQAMAARLAERLALRRIVDVVESAGVAVPIMVGWLKPVIVLPTAVISGFTPDQVEALIVHELAHIRRNDYLVNLLQAAVETVLFYHPAVWWVSGRIRAEREHCCDDVAVTICDRLVYARALSDLAALTTPALAMAASNGSLVDRVRRILGRPTAESESGAGWLPVFLILAVVAPALPATLQSAVPAVTPVQIAQAPPVPPQQSTPVAVAVAPAEPAQAVPVAVAITETPQATTTTASAVRLQTAQSAEAAAELQRVEEALKRLAEQQHETMTKEFELAIAANESQSKAQIDELIAKLKAVQQEYERAKRMADVGVASDEGAKVLQQQLEQIQREMQTVEAKRNFETSRLMLNRAQAQQKRDYDQLLEQYAKLQGYPREKTIRATGDLQLDVVDAEARPEPVTDRNATARAGDTVDVIVSGEAELPGFTIEPDGTIRLPFLGSIEVKGLTTRQIAEAVAKRLTDRKLATNPQVSVTLRRR
jgi:beta-lactamase regulating signal transducer with metallopeptidase domain